MLKVAIPNKGLLSEAASATLVAAGYRQRKDPRDLVLVDNDNLVEFYYLRPKDISIYVGSGELDAGITGRDLLINSKAKAAEILANPHLDLLPQLVKNGSYLIWPVSELLPHTQSCYLNT